MALPWRDGVPHLVGEVFLAAYFTIVQIGEHMATSRFDGGRTGDAVAANGRAPTTSWGALWTWPPAWLATAWS